MTSSGLYFLLPGRCFFIARPRHPNGKAQNLRLVILFSPKVFCSRQLLPKPQKTLFSFSNITGLACLDRPQSNAWRIFLVYAQTAAGYRGYAPHQELTLCRNRNLNYLLGSYSGRFCNLVGLLKKTTSLWPVVEVLRKALRAEPLFYVLTDTIGFLTAFGRTGIRHPADGQQVDNGRTDQAFARGTVRPWSFTSPGLTSLIAVFRFIASFMRLQ